MANQKTQRSEAASKTILVNKGKWLYFLLNEGMAMGLDSQFAKDAMYELGETYADNQYLKSTSLEGLRDCLMDRVMVEGRGAVADISDGVLAISISSCPMYSLWSGLAKDEAEPDLLYDVYCEFYRALADKKGFSFDKTSADRANNGACTLYFRA